MFVGEAPGAQEDKMGLPFVGPAGKLLEQLLGEIGLERKDVFINNTLMCRPPGNRDPLPEEIEECKPFLIKRIELIEPKVICTLGNYATKLLTGSPARDHEGPRRAAAARARRAHGDALPALPPGGGAAGRPRCSTCCAATSTACRS